MKIQTLYRWHKRLGLTLGVVLFLLAVSGVAITFRDELLPATYPRLMRVTPNGPRAPLEAVIRSALRELEVPPTHLYTSENDHTATMLFYRPPGAWLPHLLTVDPYSAQVLGRMPLLQNIFGVMLYLHANLFLGKLGGYFVGLMGLLLVAFVCSGIFLWWPRHGAWQAKWRGLLRGGRGLHRSSGLLFALPLVFSALTGFMLAFDIPHFWGRLTGSPTRPADPALRQACPIERQLAALARLTEAQRANMVSIHFCGAKNGFMKFTHGHHGRDGHQGFARLLVDPVTGETLRGFDSNKDPASWSANALTVFPWHSGAAFGLVGRVVNLFTGLALAILFLTGLIPSLKRRLKRATGPQPQGDFDESVSHRARPQL